MASKKAVIERELFSLYQERGRLVPMDVVEVATDPNHPLHNNFDWDNETAGESWRVHQAAEMIRSVKIRVITGDDNFEVRAYYPRHKIGINDGGGYTHAEDISNPESQILLLQAMQRDWTSIKRRYSHMDAFFSMINADIQQQQEIG